LKRNGVPEDFQQKALKRGGLVEKETACREIFNRSARKQGVQLKKKRRAEVVSFF